MPYPNSTPAIIYSIIFANTICSSLFCPATVCIHSAAELMI